MKGERNMKQIWWIEKGVDCWTFQLLQDFEEELATWKRYTIRIQEDVKIEMVDIENQHGTSIGMDEVYWYQSTKTDKKGVIIDSTLQEVIPEERRLT